MPICAKGMPHRQQHTRRLPMLAVKQIYLTRISSQQSLSSLKRLSLALFNTTLLSSSESVSLEPAKNLPSTHTSSACPPPRQSLVGDPGRHATPTCWPPSWVHHCHQNLNQSRSRCPPTRCQNYFQSHWQRCWSSHLLSLFLTLPRPPRYRYQQPRIEMPEPTNALNSKLDPARIVQHIHSQRLTMFALFGGLIKLAER